MARVHSCEPYACGLSWTCSRGENGVCMDLQRICMYALSFCHLSPTYKVEGRGVQREQYQRSSNSDVIMTCARDPVWRFSKTSFPLDPHHRTRNMSSKQDSGRSYHLQCTGDALQTANAHSSPEHITLFGSCFCPFVQRVWVTLEHLGIDYKVRTMFSECTPKLLIDILIVVL